MNPVRLATFGASEVRTGARVTVIRVANERVRVEIDEVDPPRRSDGLSQSLRGQGRLGVLAR